MADKAKISPKFLQLPRMTSAEIAAISSPQPGMMVFDTDFKAVLTYNGTLWLSGKQLIVDFQSNSVVLTLTNFASGTQTLGNSSRNIVLKDLRGFRQFKLTVQVETFSTGTTPIMDLQGSTDAATFTGLAASNPSCNVGTPNGVKDTGWATIDSAHRIENCYIRVRTTGGAGTGDNPTFGRISAIFR